MESFEQARVERLAFYTKCLQATKSCGRIDELLIPTLEAIWHHPMSASWFPYTSCEGHSVEEAFERHAGRTSEGLPEIGKKEALAMSHGYINLCHRYDQSLRNFLLSDLPASLSVASSSCVKIPRKPDVDFTTVTFSWHYIWREQAIAALLKKFKANVTERELLKPSSV